MRLLRYLLHHPVTPCGIFYFIFNVLFSALLNELCCYHLLKLMPSINTAYPLLYHLGYLCTCSISIHPALQRAHYRMAVAAAPWGGLITSDTSEQSTCFSPGGYLISHHSLCEHGCVNVCLWLKPSWKVPDSLITSQTVLRCCVVWMWGGRPGQISPLHWHSAGLELWAALFSWLRGSPERTVGLAEAPREAQRVFHLQQLFRQAHPRTASVFQTPAKYGRRLPTNLLMKFCMADCGRYISSQLSLIGAELILYLEIFDCQLSYFPLYVMFWILGEFGCCKSIAEYKNDSLGQIWYIVSLFFSPISQWQIPSAQ